MLSSVMRLEAWRCNPWPAVFITVAAESKEAAVEFACRRMGTGAAHLCTAYRCSELDGVAADRAPGDVLRWEEY